MSPPPSASKVRWISLALALVTFLVFSRVLTCDFTTYDDNQYVTQNAVVKQGFTMAGLRYAFTAYVAGNWHPATILSHMLDCQLFGLRPTPHHLTNLLLHAANVVLVFLLLQKMTGALWRCALVAGLFAFHPLRVESVAWVAERKDVLSTFFGLLSLLAYVRFAQETRAENLRRGVWYAAALSLFALGLMSKPMLVTWPFVMLLLDVWPLRRVSGKPSGVGRMVLEKIPFLLLSAAMCRITMYAQFSSATDQNRFVTVSDRIANAGVAYIGYLQKTVWPTKLAVLYPHPGKWPMDVVATRFAILAMLTFAVVWAMRRRPWLAMGWFWFIGTLVPVIGLIQVGLQFMADRYAYIPHIGLFIVVVWLAWELCNWLPNAKGIATVASGMFLFLFGCVTWQQLGVWRNGETLFAQAVAATTNNHTAHFNYGIALRDAGHRKEMAEQFLEALRLRPDYEPASANLGQYLFEEGDYQGATNYLAIALTQCRDCQSENYFMARALTELSDFTHAEEQFAAAASANLTNEFPVHTDWAIALARQGKLEAAIQHFETALNVEGPSVGTHANMAATLDSAGRYSEAVTHYRDAIRLKPDVAELYNNLAWLLATCPDDHVRNGNESVRLARRACELAGSNQPVVLGTMGAALAEAGRYSDAQQAALQAIASAEKNHQVEVAERNRDLLKLYEAGQPYREPPPPRK